MEVFKKIFREFTAPYLQNTGNGELTDFQLKYNHSFDVFENCCNICRSLNLDEQSTKTIQVAALFHDVGRFPQYQKYGTFRDIDSCNHATLGVRYILRKQLLKKLPPNKLKTVIGAIALHNRNRLPESIPKKIKIAAQIVRDSDKIDIIKILLPHMENVQPFSSVALMGLTEIPNKITESVICDLENKHQAAYLDMQCVNDFRLLILSWAYDLTFKWSRQEMIRRGYVDQIFEQLPKSERISRLYQPIAEQLNS